jgi:S1-C subfamily serine protease
MLLGITEHLQEERRIDVQKQVNTVTTIFLASLFLPFVIYLLFHFNIVPANKTSFSHDIQEPVAKIVTDHGIGTAFLITPTTLLTARHVVEKSQAGAQVDLFFEHSKNHLQVKATIKYIAPSSLRMEETGTPLKYFLSDIAVLEVPEISDIEPLILGESSAIRILDEVILIGYPNGDYSITKGNINNDTYQGTNLFKLDAATNPGNSGGPCILKDDNTVIGILVGSSATAQQGENIALKIDDVKQILQHARMNYER